MTSLSTYLNRIEFSTSMPLLIRILNNAETYLTAQGPILRIRGFEGEIPALEVAQRIADASEGRFSSGGPLLQERAAAICVVHRMETLWRQMTRTDLPRALEDSRNRVLRNFRTIPIAEYRRTFNGRSRGSDFHQEYEFSTGYIITHSSDGLRVSAILVHEEAILAKVHLQKGKITCRDEIKKDFFFDRSPPSSGAAVIVF